MQLQTILNRVARHSSFAYGTPRWSDDVLRPTLEVPIRERANGRPICSGCGRRRPGYDRLHERRFEFVPCMLPKGRKKGSVVAGVAEFGAAEVSATPAGERSIVSWSRADRRRA